MPPQVEDIAFIYPDRTERAAAAYRKSRPKARVVCTLSSGDERTVYVPARVARAAAKETPDLPCDIGGLTNWIDAVGRRVCYAALVEMLAQRDHGESEARDKLARIGYPPAAIDEAVERARSSRFLDEERYMRYFIAERLRRGWGRRKIEQELRRKGADPTQLADYPDAFFSDDEDRCRAAELLRRKPIPDVRPFEKLIRFLMGRGFSYGVAADAVKARLSEDGDEA